jgi:hypothetical protein
MILNYNFHNMVKMRIVRDKPFWEMKPLDMEYSYFETDSKIVPDLTVNVRKFTPNIKGCYNIDHKIYVRKDYLYSEEPDWEVEIIGLDSNKTVVNFSEKSGLMNNFRYASLVLCDHVIRPILEFKMAKKGCVLSHSASVSKDGKGILLCGPASSYKTTIAMNLVKSGYDLLGDDFTVLKGRKMMSFPRTPAVFDYRVKKLDTEEMRMIDKILVRSFYKKKGFSFIRDSNSLDYIIFPIITGRNEFKVKRIDGRTAAEKLAINNEIEDSFSPFYNYFLSYNTLFSKELIWDQLERIIDVKGVPCYTMQMSKGNCKKSIEFVEKLK